MGSWFSAALTRSFSSATIINMRSAGVVGLSVLASLMAFSQTVSPPSGSVPTIYLVYQGPNGTVFDVNCGELLKTTVSPESVNEAVRLRVPKILTTSFPEILATCR